MKGFRTKVGVPSEHLPVLVAGDQRDLVDLEARLEQATCPFMAKVVKMEIDDAERFAGSRERGAG
jgi:hypothetical protein